MPATRSSSSLTVWSRPWNPASAFGTLLSSPASGVTDWPPILSMAAQPSPRTISGVYRDAVSRMRGGLPAAGPPAIEERHEECHRTHQRERDDEQQPSLGNVHEAFTQRGIHEV